MFDKVKSLTPTLFTSFNISHKISQRTDNILYVIKYYLQLKELA